MFCLRKKTRKWENPKFRITQDPIPRFRPTDQEIPPDEQPETEIDGHRRKAFGSAPVPIDKDESITTFPKSASDEEVIEKALRANEFLSNVLSEENMRNIIEAMDLRIISSNEVIIRQGDKGNAIYISSKGTYQVIVNGSKVVEFDDKRVFGELALIYDAKRLSTVKAVTDGAVWCLDRKTYQLIVTRSNVTKEEELYNFLQSVEKLNTKAPETLRVVANLVKNAFFEAGSKIVKEGDSGDLFYIIRAGSVTVSKKDTGVVTKLVKCQCFGELALQGKDIRQATVTADPPGTDCLTLDRSDFQNYFGDIKITEIDVQKIKSLQEVPPEYMDLPLSDLHILGTLGVGGFGRVELAQSKKKKELVFALKRMAKIYIVSEGKQAHAFNEKYIQMNSQSPFIVRLYRTYKTRKYIYFLMEPCMGGDLFSLLHQQKTRKFKNDDARFIVACVMEALFYLHIRGIIYRDLKPENILIASNGYFKLADFGFAKKLHGDGAKTYTFVGTPDYTTPEVIKGKGHDKAVDYWALGVLIYELVVGKSPFSTGDPGYNRTLEKVLKGTDYVKFPDDFNSDARKLVLKFCKSNPWDRLGMSKDGINKIKGDKWFKGFDWVQLAECKLRSPFKPHLKDPTDMSYFPKQTRRSTQEPPEEMSGWDRDF